CHRQGVAERNAPRRRRYRRLRHTDRRHSRRDRRRSCATNPLTSASAQMTSRAPQLAGIRRVEAAMIGTTFFPLSGCGIIPSVNILGSFFPAWLISIVIGVMLTVVSHQAFVVTKIAPYLRPAAVLYPCLILLWTLITWLLVFAS